jgi:uncharacterized protein (DUF983 family)
MTPIDESPLGAARTIVDPSGRPARRAEDRRCPRCRATPDTRIRSGGFGSWHDVCSVCGHDFFDEQTAD